MRRRLLRAEYDRDVLNGGNVPQSGLQGVGVELPPADAQRGVAAANVLETRPFLKGEMLPAPPPRLLEFLGRLA